MTSIILSFFLEKLTKNKNRLVSIKIIYTFGVMLAENKNINISITAISAVGIFIGTTIITTTGTL
ncbi:protein of unknown function [Tenacibaculum sp. 190130A14a]|uniref:Uncharacterized protein n=1 Tax=Tenacibaculum polynesiense TaxID=3137857 RepID=A0ABP1EUB1_9FLAO